VGLRAALLYVVCVMMRGLAEIDWHDATAPAVIAVPLTHSIANVFRRTVQPNH
jgi:hypothetical protein